MSLQKWHEDLSTHRDEVEEVGSRAQEILEESHASSRMGSQATQLTSRYQALLLQVLVSCPLPWHLQETADILSLGGLHQLLLKMSDGPHRPWPWGFHPWFNLSLLSQEQIKFLEEEIQSLEETESSLSCYSDWYVSTQKNFKNVATKIDKVDEVMMGKKLKTLEVGRHPSGSNLPHPLMILFHWVDLEADSKLLMALNSSF